MHVSGTCLCSVYQCSGPWYLSHTSLSCTISIPLLPLLMATEDSEEYLAVLKASYDYQPQSDEEIAIKEDQLLFLLQKTDQEYVCLDIYQPSEADCIVPSWWKVKIKGESQEEESPSGLVPAAYVEQVSITQIHTCIYYRH